MGVRTTNGGIVKKLLCTAAVSAAFFSLPVQAHEVGLLIDKQFGSSQSVVIGTDVINFEAVKPTGFGIRGAYTLLNLKVAELGVNATYHPSAKDDLKVDGVKVANFENEYFAIGGQVEWKFLVNLHAGVELRHEKLSVSNSVFGTNDSATQTRAWVTAGLGFSVPMPVISPFVRLEVAYATSNADLPATYSGSDFDKILAPKYQIALYGGVRF
jgi:hypothetical protein